jgi:hypothetical protein
MDTCRGCAAHSECASAVCTSDGSCAAAAMVAYVSDTGTDTGTCPMASPCKTITFALTQNPRYVKIHGMISDRPVINNQTVTLAADAGATLSATTAGPLVTVSGTSVVEIDDLHVTGALGGTGSGYGIWLNSQNASVKLNRVEVDQCGYIGVSATGGSLTIARSTIHENTGGGVEANNTTFDITNTFIYRNLDSRNSFIGGARLIPAAGTTSRFAFNTVVDNNIESSSLNSGGVTCDATFAAPNNIIARNHVNLDATATNANTIGMCTYPTSAIAMTVTAFNFVSPDNPTPYNYHLQAGSVAIDTATTTMDVDVDFDGDIRPQGMAKDQGADEYKP